MSSVCIQLIVVAVTLSLSDVACQTVHNGSISDDVHSGRQRRQAQPLTQPLIAAFVDHHNILRSLEGAGDMQLMVWNTSLASRAAAWTATCRGGHGYNSGIGQNVFGADKEMIDIAPVIETWYSEKKQYTFDSHKCDKGRMCGHYLQVVWANAHQVGCAAHRCPGWTSVVCNYWHGGNVGDARPYTKGPACSMCGKLCNTCLLYTSPSPRDGLLSRMPSSA